MTATQRNTDVLYELSRSTESEVRVTEVSLHLELKSLAKTLCEHMDSWQLGIIVGVNQDAEFKVDGILQ